MIYADTSGRAWTIVDYHFVGRQRKRVALGDWKAEGRAFVPDGWEGPVMLHNFGYTPYRDTDKRTLARQLAGAKPANARPVDRMYLNG